MLDEVELLVAGGDPEVVPVVANILATDAPNSSDRCEAGLPAERWIGETEKLARMVCLLGRLRAE